MAARRFLSAAVRGAVAAPTALFLLPKLRMATTQKARNRPHKASSNGSSAKAPPEHGAGLWKFFPVLMVLVGIVVGILVNQPATDGAVGEPNAGTSQEAGEIQ